MSESIVARGKGSGLVREILELNEQREISTLAFQAYGTRAARWSCAQLNGKKGAKRTVMWKYSMSHICRDSQEHALRRFRANGPHLASLRRQVRDETAPIPDVVSATALKWQAPEESRKI